ncbi:MAG: glycosyltransferase [Chloroflexi bacterium]|nr:glycosyltransferase [Chloroflexota bacterium]
MSKKALLVMAKRPFPGQTKTRLAAYFDHKSAADLYTCFLQDVLALARSIPNVTPFIAYAPPNAATDAYFHALAPDFERVPQVGATLGNRLDHVLSHCLDNGYTQVAAMNSDSPNLPATYLADAFTHLDNPETDVVFGPCEDGGYYLIGWKRPYPQLVRNVQMSTDHVLDDTLAIAAAANINAALLPVWYDIDEAADLARLQTDLALTPNLAPQTCQFLKAFFNAETQRRREKPLSASASLR